MTQLVRAERAADALNAFLDEVCDRLDRQGRVRAWRRWRPSLLGVPAAVGLSLALTQCGGSTSHETSHECAGDDCAELCRDGIDNDGDGTVDCEDAECLALSTCLARTVFR